MSTLAGSIIAAAALASVFDHGPTPAANLMPSGGAAAAPVGFLDYCRRAPDDCGVDAEDANRALADAPSRWAAKFAAARQRSSAPSAIQSAGRSVEVRSAAGSAAARPGDEVTPTGETGSIALTPELWRGVRKINARINRAIYRRDDRVTYGVDDYWAAPLASGVRAGDCEDYALEKRRALIQAGVPRQAVSLALVTTPWGESHAVLLLSTDRGEYVLDSLTPWIVPWDQTSYHWRIRQKAGRASEWVSVGPPSQRIATAF